MRFSLPPALVKNALAGHSWIGVLVGIPMYLICLSGTIAVLYPEFERWEQPTIAETLDYDVAQVSRAYTEALARQTEETEHMFVSLPREDLPRLTVASDHGGWYVNPDGSLGDEVAHDWTHFLIDLHLFLHLPESFGMIVVSIMGALLCALIISGFLTHPRIFRDAFILRIGGSRQLEQADIHNRLSVWGAPFHLMIAITGAYFGLVGLMALISASAFYNGDTDRVMAEVFGAEPALEQEVRPADVGRALAAMAQIAPEAAPMYITVEEVNTPEQFIMVGAVHPQRLIYAEQYRFDAAGQYLDKVGFSDGPAGRQAIFSVYRLHFGHFAGLPMKVLYVVFGFALTVISVTGINIWLARRRRVDWFNPVWNGIVWSTPAGLAMSAVGQVFLGIPGVPLFWGTLVAGVVFACVLREEKPARAWLQAASGLALIVTVLWYYALFGGAGLAGAAPWINLTIFASGCLILWLAWRQRAVVLASKSGQAQNQVG